METGRWWDVLRMRFRSLAKRYRPSNAILARRIKKRNVKRPFGTRGPGTEAFFCTAVPSIAMLLAYHY